MTVTKRSFLFIFSIISAILLTLNVFSYFLFRDSITNQLLSSQKAVISSNSTLYNFFTQEINQLIYQYTSDPELGTLLGSKVGNDPLEDAQLKAQLDRRIAYHLSSQTTLSNNNFSVSLFINPNLPISNLFSFETTTPGVSHLFSGSIVENEDWYQAALQLGFTHYIFVNKEKNTLCFSRKLQSSHYPNSYLKNGVGVWLGSLPLARVPHFFSFSPITPNSGFILLNNRGNRLYKSEKLPDFPVFSPKNTSNEYIEIDGQRFIYSYKQLNWGLKFIFLTPYSDISSYVTTMMIPYLICSIVFLVIGTVCSIILSHSLSNPVVNLTRAINSIEDARTVDIENFNVRGALEIQHLSKSFIDLIKRIRTLNQQVELSFEQRRLSELRALQAQMNPHFVLNAMNIVNYMALSRGDDDIAQTVDSIANLMRYSITHPDKLVNITTEIENIREYISIYTLRFRQNIVLDVTLDPPNDSLVIPKFTLQPLVENSIRHGISRHEQGISIHIHAYHEDDSCIVEVTDSGRGANPEILNSYLRYENVDLEVTNGFGIRNVNERLLLHSNNRGGLSYYCDKNGRLVAKITVFLVKKSTP